MTKSDPATGANASSSVVESTISWKCTSTRAYCRFRKSVELWISSDTLFRRSCFARLPNTKSIASITFDLPEPFGPTTEEKDCAAKAGRGDKRGGTMEDEKMRRWKTAGGEGGRGQPWDRRRVLSERVHSSGKTLEAEPGCGARRGPAVRRRASRSERSRGGRTGPGRALGGAGRRLGVHVCPALTAHAPERLASTCYRFRASRSDPSVVPPRVAFVAGARAKPILTRPGRRVARRRRI